MRIFLGLFVLLVLVICRSDACCAEAPVPDAPSPDGRIEAVLVRGDKDVLASDGVCLYRASLADKKWHALRTPKEMPLMGAFVAPPPERATGDTVLFCAPEPEMAIILDDPKTGDSHVATGAAARGKTPYGLYRSTDAGETWKLLSDARDFQFVYWHPDNTLYALGDRTNAIRPKRVYHSIDGGATWDDITHGLEDAGYGGLVSIFRDPDHPALVCVTAQGVRGYVIQASDDNYRWRGAPEWVWEEKHRTDEQFLATNYAFTGIDSISDYQFSGTFGNYFAHPFGNQTMIDAFELRTEKNQYTFSPQGPKGVRATMRFRPTDRPAISYDLDGDGTDFWGLRVIDAAGHRITITAKARERADKEKDAQKEYDARPDIRRIELTSDRPYSREVDLGKLFTFPGPGVYRVQLVYENPWWAAEGRAHWTGTFGSNVMTIKIGE